MHIHIRHASRPPFRLALPFIHAGAGAGAGASIYVYVYVYAVVVSLQYVVLMLAHKERLIR
jgi:hypothetical protein